MGEAFSNELFRLTYLGPLRSYPARHLAFAEDHDRNWKAGGGQLGCYPKQWKREVMDRARALVREKINTEMQVTRMESKLSGEEAKPKFRKVSTGAWMQERQER